MPRELSFSAAVTVTALLVLIGSAACDSGEVAGSLPANRPSTTAIDTTGSAETTFSSRAGEEQNVAGDFYEVLLKWGASGADPRVRQWLEARGLTAMSMRAGMLTLASPGQIEKSFGVSIEGAEPPLELPVPEELRSSISSITVLKPRSYH